MMRFPSFSHVICWNVSVPPTLCFSPMKHTLSRAEVRHSALLCNGMWLVEVQRLANKAVPNVISQMLSRSYGIMELQQKCLTDQTDGLTRLTEKELLLFSALHNKTWRFRPQAF